MFIAADLASLSQKMTIHFRLVLKDDKFFKKAYTCIDVIIELTFMHNTSFMFQIYIYLDK